MIVVNLGLELGSINSVCRGENVQKRQEERSYEPNVEINGKWRQKTFFLFTLILHVSL